MAKTVTSTELFANLYNSPSSLLAQLGIAILGYDMYRGLSSIPVSPFTGHPAFNSLGLALLLQGVLLAQSVPKNAEMKHQLGFMHGMLCNLAVLFFIFGSGSIYYNKYINGALHYTTWHALIGAATYSLLVTVALVGNIIFFLPIQVFGSVNKAKSFYKYHRLFGYCAVSLVTITNFSALYTNFNESTLHFGGGKFLLCFGLIWSGLISRIDKKKFGF